jgi:hypothetical protein
MMMTQTNLLTKETCVARGICRLVLLHSLHTTNTP